MKRIVLCILGLAMAAGVHAKTLLVLGDSLSAEYGLSRGQGWAALLQQKLREGGSDYTVANASISGETSSGGLARLPALLAQHKPQVLVIELGANDGLRGLQLKATEENFRKMIAAGKAAGARILLVGMRIPPNYGQDYSEGFYAMYGKLAKSAKLPLVNFLLEPIAAKPEMFQSDRRHPVAAAQPLLLENIWPQLKLLLK
ncbi:MAG: arylesterase [Candidatus Protistobacter heckmanni]|nr:arylesterase [Candidatus Protistobacter heckmanni]